MRPHWLLCVCMMCLCAMASAETPRDVKAHVVYLHFTLGWTCAAIVYHYRNHVHGFCLRTCQRIIQSYLLHGRVMMQIDVGRDVNGAISSEHVAVLLNICDAVPHLYVDELQEELERRCGVRYSWSVVERALLRNHYTAKVLVKMAAQRDVLEREDYAERIAGIPASNMVFIDESHFEDSMLRRRRGRAPRGENPRMFEVLSRDNNMSVLAAFTTNGFLTDGSVTLNAMFADIQSSL